MARKTRLEKGRPVQPRPDFPGTVARSMRIELDLSAREIGAMIGVALYGRPISVATVCNWETGRSRPSQDERDELERVLKCKLRSA